MVSYFYQAHCGRLESRHCIRYNRSATRWTIDESLFDSSQGKWIFLCPVVLRPALEPTRLPTQFVRGEFSRMQRDWGMNLISHLHLVRKLWMSRAIHPFPHVPSCFAQGQMYFNSFTFLYCTRCYLCWSMCDNDVNIPDVGQRFALICLYHILLHKRWILTHRYSYRRYKFLRLTT
jgi:hypothetical protein